MESEKANGARITITWAGGDLTVKGNVDNPQTIAILEMAKALMMQKTLGQARTGLPDQIMAAKVPAFNPRQIDR